MATVGESQANEEYAKMREALWLAIAQRDAARQSRARLVLALRKYRKTERVWEMFSLMEIVKERSDGGRAGVGKTRKFSHEI